MEIKEFLLHRSYLLDDSKDEDGFISDSSFLGTCLPYLNDTKLIDTDECNECYCFIESQQVKVNGYIINESGERLQLLVINEDALSPSASDEQLMISQKAIYDKLFARAVNFAKKSSKKQLGDYIQDSSPAKILNTLLSTVEGLKQIDVIEVLLISPTATIETRGEQPQSKRIEFEEEKLDVTWTEGKVREQKSIVVLKKLIDLNFLYNVTVSQGNRAPLTVDFSNYRINCIQAASEDNYESYLCVLPAVLISDLYKYYSSRMLEKNVRSFLQLKNSVNKGIQDTIRKAPEKFIAYNNGLTITATSSEIIEEEGKLYIKNLSDFQIVNGGQTTATIYFSHKAGLDIGKVKVMAKINVAKNASEDELDELISDISAFSNAQSRVSPVDLRSRNLQLVKLKSLTESIITPSGKKWFFERAKGEFNTLIRKSPNKKTSINKEFPKERRFTKEDLAKYYTSWGDVPFLVKKGGEKVFRLFIENISGDGKNKKPVTIDRGFYEELIARVILFRSLEKLYGNGNNAIGQIRSAVVPYSISILFKSAAGAKGTDTFNLLEIWKKEGLSEELSQVMVSLMTLMNNIIKKYASSDDYGEYSKRAELWNAIKECLEIKEFVDSDNFKKVLKKYAQSREDAKLAQRRKSLKNEISFGPLYEMVRIYSNTPEFYKQIHLKFFNALKPGEIYKLEQLIGSVNSGQDIQPQHIDFEHFLLDKIRVDSPEFFDTTIFESGSLLKDTLDFIVAKYNTAIENGQDIIGEFSGVRQLAAAKGASNTAVYDEIGKMLRAGQLPTIQQLKHASVYVSLLNG